jgi:hypothetical protein
MSGNGFEYPDEAGYPDGTGTLHEGTEDAEAPDAAEEASVELNEFAMEDEEDLDGNV